MTRLPRATIDFETRSAVSLKKAGPWRYSIDPSTDVLCLAFRLPHWEKGRTGLWHHAWPSMNVNESDDYDDVAELVEWIESGGLVEAHNVWFEFCIWNNILVPVYGFPAMPHASWRCSAAKASAHALPRKLEMAVAALRLPNQKDVEGGKVMLKVSKPRKLRKGEKAWFLAMDLEEPDTNWHEDMESFARLCAYCRKDVLAEEGLSEALDDLSPHETEMFLMDLSLNHRGFQLDERAVATALRLIESESRILNNELAVVTDGYVTKATQRQNMKVWLESEGLLLTDTQGPTIDAALAGRIDSKHASRALELMRTLGRSSTAKYQRMADWAGTDYRVRGGLLYHGASTGRWSGAGIQPHNFPKGSVDKKNPAAMQELWDALFTEDRPTISRVLKAVTKVVGGVMEALSQALRGAITAAPGHTLFVADYASIEARVLLWLADDQRGLDIFRRHEDPYCDMAADIYHRAITKADEKERGLGKIAVLGLGYQMGAAKFTDTCAKFGIDILEDIWCESCGKTLDQHRYEDHDFDSDVDPETITSVKVVRAYREKYAKVKQLWADMEASAIACVETKIPVECGNVRWLMRGNFLYCELPSGRRLAYPFPRVEMKTTSWGAVKATLTYMGVDAVTRQWRRQPSYGGLLVENIVQAEARDLMADAMLRCEASGTYHLVLSVHDELIAEALDGEGDVKAFEALMAECPDWATGCPVEAEGWAGKRYRK